VYKVEPVTSKRN